MRKSPNPGACVCVAALLLVVIIGCSETDELARESVSGAVVFDGKPLEKGQITFLPENPELPTQSGAGVSDGKYSIASAEGLVPGKYRVVISSGGAGEQPTDTANNMPGMAPPLPKELIPAEYNSKSTLSAEVKSGGGNTFDFDLKKSANSKK